MKPKRATPEKQWPLEKLRFYDVFMLQCGWSEPRNPQPTALRSIMTEADFKLAWEENRAEVLRICEEPGPYHCRHKVCTKPGTRPGPWWDYEAPGERRRIPNPEFQAPRYGMLPSQIEWLEEPEPTFLLRWGLLSEKERRLLERNQEKDEEASVVKFGRRQQIQALEEDDEEDNEDEAS